MRVAVNSITGATVDAAVFAAAVADPVCRPVTFAEIYYAGVLTGVRLPLIGGSMRWTRGQLHQTQGDVVWHPNGDPLLTPGAPGSLIARLLTELRLWRGVMLADGTPAVCSLGVHILSSWAYSDDGTVRAELDARSQRISRARLEQPVQWTAGMVLEEAVAGMLQAAWPDIDVQFVGDTHTAPAVIHEARTDPWEACTAAARGKSCWLYPDDLRFLWTPEPTLDANAAPVFAFDAGDLVSLVPSSGSDGFANRTIVTSSKEGLTAPIVGSATLTEPSDPGRYDGPIGRIPQWRDSPLVDDVAEANAMAATIQRQTRSSVEYSYSGRLDPRMQLVDPTRLTDTSRWIDAIVFTDEISMDLTGDSFTATAGRADQVDEG